MAKPRPIKQIFDNIRFDGISFSALVRAEGSKNNGVCLTVPSKACKDLIARGWNKEWIEGEIAGHRYITRARFNGNAGILVVPKRLQHLVAVDDLADVIVRNPEAQRARGQNWITPEGVDWAALVFEDDVFPTENDGVLQLHNSYEMPFQLKRITAWETTMWLFGFYLAEGSKKSGLDWSLINQESRALQRVIECLSSVGIPRERLYLQVLHGQKQTAEEIRPKYEMLNVEISTIRPRADDYSAHAAVLHVRNSLYFRRMFLRAIQKLSTEYTAISEAACRAFAFGFLVGDGSFTLLETGMVLRFTGSDEEQSRCVLDALNRGMCWQVPYKNRKSAASGGGDEQTFSVDSLQTAELILYGAFKEHAGNLERLHTAIKRQTSNFKKLWSAVHDKETFSYSAAPAGAISGLKLHGYVETTDGGLRFTEKGKRLADKLSQIDQAL